MLILYEQQLFFCLNSFDLAKIPRLCLDTLQFGHIVGRDIAFLLGCLTPGKPPIALSVIYDFEMFSLLETQVFVSPSVVVIEGHKDFHAGRGGLRRVWQRPRGSVVDGWPPVDVGEVRLAPGQA